MIIRDLTNRIKTEQALTESEEKYRSLFNNMQSCFVYCKILSDCDGKPIDFTFVEVNSAFEKLTRVKRADLIGKPSSAVFVGVNETNPEFYKAFFRIASTGKTEHFEAFIKQIDSWLSVSAYGLKKGYFAAIIEDITEQKRNQEELEGYSYGLELTVAARTEELKETHERLLKAERFAAIGELAGSVGHDLRNPLTSIKNAAYYLNRKLGAMIGANEKMMLDVINKSVDHANKIIASLLEYSKNITLEIEECTPKSLLDYVLLMAQIPKCIKVKDQAQDDLTIWVDTGKMERVFLNLIKNAVEAMPQGGTLTIASRRVGDVVEFTFADTGVGISEVNKDKIFMPLFTTKAQGMGFGLAICRRIVEAHEGKITVDSILGKGTTFTVTLPVEHKLKILPQEDVVEFVDSQSQRTP
jgi:PAS domain S-box-containing protein